MIRKATLNDAQAITDIYNYYIENTVVTFDEQPLEVATITEKMQSVMKTYSWLVTEVSGKVVGFAYASEWRAKSAYKHSVESTIYLGPETTGMGLGLPLYSELFRQLKAMHIHTAIGVLSVPNEASVALHKKMGFVKAAHFKEVGLKFGQWIDVEYWQLML